MPGSLEGARILVTGAAGFLGRHLCRCLGADGASVVGVSRSPLFDAPPVGGSTWLQADLGLESECPRVMGEASPDVIYQLAGVVSGSRWSLVKPTFLANLASTVYLMELAVDRVASFIQLGSLEEPTEEKRSRCRRTVCRKPRRRPT